MAAALTIAVLFAMSVAIVRIASVAMRLTGLPETVARFQCLSALTGTGFTTGESEMIVNYPIRRRILVALMILGNLGLISIGATFIVAFVDTGTDADAVFLQAVAFAAAIGLTFIVATNRPLDRAMCGLIGAVLLKVTSLGARRYQRLLQLENGYSVAEHVCRTTAMPTVASVTPDDDTLLLLSVRPAGRGQIVRPAGDITLSPNDIVVCYATETAHDALEDALRNGGAPEHDGQVRR